MLVAPWESVHRSPRGLTFQASTLGVRELYRAWQLEVPDLHREPDDHIAFEIAFLAHLSLRAAEALETSDLEALERSLEAQRSWPPRQNSPPDSGRQREESP